MKYFMLISMFAINFGAHTVGAEPIGQPRESDLKILNKSQDCTYFMRQNIAWMIEKGGYFSVNCEGDKVFKACVTLKALESAVNGRDRRSLKMWLQGKNRETVKYHIEQAFNDRLYSDRDKITPAALASFVSMSKAAAEEDGKKYEKTPDGLLKASQDAHGALARWLNITYFNEIKRQMRDVRTALDLVDFPIWISNPSGKLNRCELRFDCALNDFNRRDANKDRFFDGDFFADLCDLSGDVGQLYHAGCFTEPISYQWDFDTVFKHK